MGLSRNYAPAAGSTRAERSITLAAPAAFFGYLAYLLSAPFHSGYFWMDYMQDDFFYYLKVAQEIAAGYGSTFNGLVPTNGYHPLYEWLLVVLSKITSSPSGILRFLAISIFLSASATFALTVSLFRRFGLRTLPSVVLSIATTMYALRTLYYGMEVNLTIPLAMATAVLVLKPQLWTRNGATSFSLGLLMSATVLSRLDSIILITLLIVAILSSPEVRRALKKPIALGFLLGLVPLAAYFLFNHFCFGTWLPVSGMAKQLKPSLRPTRPTWDSLRWYLSGHFFTMLPIPVAIAVLLWRRRRFTSLEFGTALALLSFPWIYYFVLCCRSDWRMWGWYLYALRPALCMAIAVLCMAPPLKRLLGHTAVLVVLLVALLGAFMTTAWRIQGSELYAASQDLQRFEGNHPGVYAMGDRAGSVGYLLHSPLVQTEGLVMDRAFLENIRLQRPLLDVLKNYHVRYYVASIPGSTMDAQGCLHAQEPSQAGSTSPRMRAVLCQAPVLQLQHMGMQTFVYDLQSPSSPRE